MCYAVTCPKCGKTTWAGCGQHVDQVMRNVPPAQRCTCEENAPKGTSAESGLFSKLFGR
ncbi:hypothetical protein [Pseudoclavibacter caeni]|jgi:phage terminase large subunit GpA-like protein|uniref:hypothetical protein n=1 Tax=Pseudoclavibacter caeni TaxID=908846 RepID=UPI0015CD3E55|nr:hypothetical protein [Pseudoclavibacter caeni]NYJ96482.1 phage terminase large subunit GpA-like protein [Pseudoclavibacter caeni]